MTIDLAHRDTADGVDREHDLGDADCWCNPEVVHVPPMPTHCGRGHVLRKGHETEPCGLCTALANARREHEANRAR